MWADARAFQRRTQEDWVRTAFGALLLRRLEAVEGFSPL